MDSNFSSTVSENEAQDRIEKMEEMVKSQMKGTRNNHSGKKNWDDGDARLRKGNRKSKARKNRFDINSDDDENFYDE